MAEKKVDPADWLLFQDPSKMPPMKLMWTTGGLGGYSVPYEGPPPPLPAGPTIQQRGGWAKANKQQAIDRDTWVETLAAYDKKIEQGCSVKRAIFMAIEDHSRRNGVSPSFRTVERHLKKRRDAEALQER
jgi:hypothetical protein